MTVPGLPTSHLAALIALGGVERDASCRPLQELPAGLGEGLVELVEADRLVVAPDPGGLVGELLGSGLLVGPGPVVGRVGDPGRVEQVLVVEQHDVGERARQAVLLAVRLVRLEQRRLVRAGSTPRAAASDAVGLVGDEVLVLEVEGVRRGARREVGLQLGEVVGVRAASRPRR